MYTCSFSSYCQCLHGFLFRQQPSSIPNASLVSPLTAPPASISSSLSFTNWDLSCNSFQARSLCFLMYILLLILSVYTLYTHCQSFCVYTHYILKKFVGVYWGFFLGAYQRHHWCRGAVAFSTQKTGAMGGSIARRGACVY